MYLTGQTTSSASTSADTKHGTSCAILPSVEVYCQIYNVYLTRCRGARTKKIEQGTEK
jgi:hypothetical protein